MSNMADFRFDSSYYDEDEIGKALVDAAKGFARTDDPSQEGDASGWASRLIEAAVAAGMAEAAGRAVGKLLLSDDAAQVDLGARLQLSHKVVGAEDMLAAMTRLRGRGDWAHVRLLATPLSAMVLAGPAGYDRALRDFAADKDTREKLMKLYLRYDRKWVALNVKALIPGEAGEAESLLFWGLRGLLRADVEAVERDLTPVLGALPKDAAQAVTAQIKQALSEAR
jgi:hypothetical protein